MSVVQDTVIMPDKYSTGVRKDQTLTDVVDLGVGIDTTNTRIIFTRANISILKDSGYAEDIDDGRTLYIHNLSFNGIYLQIAAPYLWADHDLIVFENCKFDAQDQLVSSTIIRGGTTTDSSNTNQMPINRESLIFRYCDFTGEKCNTILYSCMPATFDHCKAYELGSDAFNHDNPYSKVLDCYGYNLGKRNSFNGDNGDAHADFIQSQGAMDKIFPEDTGQTGVYVRRCRSDHFQYHNLDNDKYYMSNAVIYLDTDAGNINFDIDYMWGVGGSYTYRAGLSKSDTWVKGTGTHLYSGTSLYRNKHVQDGLDEVIMDTEDISTVLVGSVWSENDVINLSVTNYTDVPRTFKIKTNLGESEDSDIFACPTMSSLCTTANHIFYWGEGKSWENDFPMDRLYTIPSNGVAWVQVYDTTDGEYTLVRTQVFTDLEDTTGDSDTTDTNDDSGTTNDSDTTDTTEVDENIPTEFSTVVDLLNAICDVTRRKLGTQNLINYIDLPSQIFQISSDSDVLAPPVNPNDISPTESE